VGINETLLFFFNAFKAISGEFFGRTFFSLFGNGAKLLKVLLGFVMLKLRGILADYVFGILNGKNLSLKNYEILDCSYLIDR
jgi:hypothetical protein